jgi:hypothetical protein
VGEPFNPDVTPVRMTSTFEHPANDWRPAITVKWYQGGDMPDSPAKYIDLSKIDHGAMFRGTKGYLIAGFDNRILIPYGDTADLTYYKPRTPETVIPAMGDFQKQWINACKGGDMKTACDFEYSSNMIEQLLLGLAAYRAGGKLDYDGAAGRFTNNDAANQYLSRKYRDGWKFEG